MTSSHRARRAFTLIELLVTISIVGVLASIAFGAMQGASNRTRKVREVAAAKNVITGFLLTPADNNGRYLLGYDNGSPSLTAPGGKVIGGEAAYRYPYRLASYFNWQLAGTILVNSNVRQLGSNPNEYAVSLNPALGMNISLVGGEQHEGKFSWPGECLTVPEGGASIIAFASAAFDNGSQRTSGYFKVSAPRLGGAWSTAPWTTNSKVADYGQVDARLDGQAVCAFTDGSVRTLSIDELRDMRLWSRVAADKNDPNYVPVNTATGGAGM